MIIRLCKEDALNIASLCDANFSDGWTYDMLCSGFDGGRLCALAKIENGQIVAVILFSVGIDDADIEIVLTDKNFRRKGYAKTLILEAEREIKKHGISRILLEVREGNESAINLYKDCGYQKISVRKKYYKDGENDLVMCKEI